MLQNSRKELQSMAGPFGLLVSMQSMSPCQRPEAIAEMTGWCTNRKTFPQSVLVMLERDCDWPAVLLDPPGWGHRALTARMQRSDI